MSMTTDAVVRPVRGCQSCRATVRMSYGTSRFMISVAARAAAGSFPTPRQSCNGASSTDTWRRQNTNAFGFPMKRLPLVSERSYPPAISVGLHAQNDWRRFNWLSTWSTFLIAKSAEAGSITEKTKPVFQMLVRTVEPQQRQSNDLRHLWDHPQRIQSAFLVDNSHANVWARSSLCSMSFF